MGEEPIYRLVRRILDADHNDDGFWGSSKPADNSKIRARLIELGDRKDFPDENAPLRATMEHHLAKPFREYSIGRVLDTIEALGVELEALEEELPIYYRRGPNSKLEQALRVARGNESRWAKERDERGQR